MSSDLQGGLNWRDRAHWGGRRLPCRHCGRPAFCRDDDGVPAHKVCAELAAATAEHTDSGHIEPSTWGLSA